MFHLLLWFLGWYFYGWGGLALVVLASIQVVKR